MIVASTRSTRFDESYSARVIRTVSVAGGGGAFTGLIVSDALRVKPLNVALIVAVVVALTAAVLTVNVADDAPAATVTDAGTVADGLLLARVTTVADGAVALSLTVPWTEFPPLTDVALKLTDESESGVGVGVAGVIVTITSRRPS